MPSSTPRALTSGLVAIVAAGALLLTSTPALAQPAAPPPQDYNSLVAGEELVATEFRSSEPGDEGYHFFMEPDGDAVLYNPDDDVVFSTGTAGRGDHLAMQADGNVVVYSADDRPVWSTGTDDEAGSYLVLQTDGNLVLYRQDGTPAWASSVGHRIPEPADSDLDAGQTLRRGHQLTSDDGRFRAVMQRDGNLVGYSRDGVVWNTGTTGPDNRLVLQEDGNAVIYAADDSVQWASGTTGAGSRLVLTNTGSLEVLGAGWTPRIKPLWDSRSQLPGALLYAPEGLDAGEQLLSDNGLYRAVLQRDSNFVVYGPNGAVWSTGTSGSPAVLRFDYDDTVRGLLELRSAQNVLTWSNTPAAGAVEPFRLVMQGDGNLVEYDGHDRPIWSIR